MTSHHVGALGVILVLVLSVCISQSGSASEEKWGDCKVRTGNCGEGTQTSNKLVLVRGGSSVKFNKRNCSVPCGSVDFQNLLLRDVEATPGSGTTEEVPDSDSSNMEPSPDSLHASFSSEPEELGFLHFTSTTGGSESETGDRVKTKSVSETEADTFSGVTNEDGSCSANVVEHVYEDCNVTCGAGFERVILLQNNFRPCGDRLRPCFVPCNQSRAIYYEKMTECEGDCKQSELLGNNNTVQREQHDSYKAQKEEAEAYTVQGTQLYMKFCHNTPCAIKTEICTLQCSQEERKDGGEESQDTEQSNQSPDNQMPDWRGYWSECTARCGEGTQSTTDQEGNIITRPCNGTCDSDSDEAMQSDSELPVPDWSECSTVCGVGIQTRENTVQTLNNVKLCHGSCESKKLVWSDWSVCKCSEKGHGVSSHYQINCNSSYTTQEDCFEETMSCEDSCTDTDHRTFSVHGIRIEEGEEEVTLAEGSSLQLTCVVLLETTTPSHNDVTSPGQRLAAPESVELSWITVSQDNEKIEYEEHVVMKSVNENYSLLYNVLRIKSLKAEHAVGYLCKVISDTGAEHTSIKPVKVFSFLKSPHNVTVASGGKAVLTCHVQHPEQFNSFDVKGNEGKKISKVYITWYKDEHVLFSLVHVRAPIRSLLTVYNAEQSDQGRYYCKARSGELKITSEAGHVTVTNTELSLQTRAEVQETEAEWSAWSECSHSCDMGLKLRSRQLSEETTENNIAKCNYDAGDCDKTRGGKILGVVYSVTSHHVSVLSDWSTWGECDKDSCLRRRTRECLSSGCDEDLLTNQVQCDNCGVPSSTPTSQERLKEYTVGRYSACSTNCGLGVTVRPIFCTDCDQIMFELDSCMTVVNCDGNNLGVSTDVTIFSNNNGVEVYSEWTEWGECDCNTVTQTRTRTCLATVCPGEDEGNCPDCSLGVVLEERTCKEQCEEDYFTHWTEWGQCKPHCGPGRRYRTRSCKGYLCTGRLSDSEPCNTECTEVDYLFTQWSSWSHCSDQLYRVRTRECVDESNCPNTDELKLDVEYCVDILDNTDTVGEIGHEGEDGELGEEEEEGEEEKDKEEDGEEDRGEEEGEKTEGDKNEVTTGEETSDSDAAGEASYGEWSNWSPCEDQDYKYRSRECTGECNEAMLQEVEECEDKTTPTPEILTPTPGPKIEDYYTQWGEWSECTEQGTRSRTRGCLDNSDCPLLSHLMRDTEKCAPEVSDPSEMFEEWSVWSDCVNQQFRLRTRTCKPVYNCTNHSHLSRELDYCPPSEEELLGRWLNQGACQVGPSQCGDGEQMKVRQCYLDKPRSCPEESMRSSECDDSNFFECTKLFKIVPCRIQCDNENSDEWVRYGECVMTKPRTTCGSGSQLNIRSCFQKGECKVEELGCSDLLNLAGCPALLKSEECEVPCPLTPEPAWNPVPANCDVMSCAIPVDMEQNFLEMKYRSSSSFYGAIELIGEQGKIGFIAWGVAGVLTEGCGPLARFRDATPSPWEQDREITWTLNISEQEILLIAGGVISHRIKIDSCRSKYSPSKIKYTGFRNFKALVGAKYRFVEKGRTGVWENIGQCSPDNIYYQCGQGKQIQGRECLRTGGCPVLMELMSQCSYNSPLSCSGLVRSVNCTIPCSDEDEYIEKREMDTSSSPGPLVEYGNGICHLPYGISCGEGEIVMVYSCFLAGSCPTEYLGVQEGCHSDNILECFHALSLLPCHIPCPVQLELGEWENSGTCELLGETECGVNQGTQLQIRDCVNTKTCQRSNSTVQECSDPWHCSDFFRSVPCTVECENQLGTWQDLHTCVPDTGECGEGALVQVRTCHVTHACPSWASSTLQCEGDLTQCSQLFRSLQCNVVCEEEEVWEELGNCLVGEECGTGTQILAHHCVQEDNCLELFACEDSSVFSCEEAFTTRPCEVECHPDLGQLVKVGGCLVEDGESCGDGHYIEVYSCYFDNSCPGYLATCQNFLDCPELYQLSPCTVQCENELGDWVEHGQCHPEKGACGVQAGTQLLVRECIESKTCPRNIDPDCTEILSCSSLFKFSSCDVPCLENKEDELLGDWKDIYHCISNNVTTGCGVGTKPQMRDCMNTKSCPRRAMEDPACFDHFNCSTLFRTVDCVVVCANSVDSGYTIANILHEDEYVETDELVTPAENSVEDIEDVEDKGEDKDEDNDKDEKSDNGEEEKGVEDNSSQVDANVNTDEGDDEAFDKEDEKDEKISVLPTQSVVTGSPQTESETSTEEENSEKGSGENAPAVVEEAASSEDVSSDDKDATEEEKLEVDEETGSKDTDDISTESEDAFPDNTDNTDNADNKAEEEESAVKEEGAEQDEGVQEKEKESVVEKEANIGSDTLRRYTRELRPTSCEELLLLSTDLQSGVYTLYNSSGHVYRTYCRMVEVNLEPQAWTLLGSFVNTDNVVSWGGAGNSNWTNSDIFGVAEKAELADFKSEAWSNVAGRELLIEDRYGWMSFYLGEEKTTILDLLSKVKHCTSVPYKGPGRNVMSSSKTWREAGVLMIYPAKTKAQGCNRPGEVATTRETVPVLGFGGTGCGLLGAGMMRSYFDQTLDWHMSLNEATTCSTVRCDFSRCGGPWNGLVLATSRDYLNNEGAHDSSTWGKLYIR